MSRRAYLLAAIQADGRPLTAAGAVDLMDGSPWPTTGRRTVQKDLRAFAARGLLAPVDAAGRRTYHPTTPDGDA
ncbi:hypothetical protein [Streptomyces sp. NPDC060194]|uniref:hypothetical protein n=1 Tax=Streptomyces sp. NPDC060194 TaxID=3347069 RepID=UPI00365C26FB